MTTDKVKNLAIRNLFAGYDAERYTLPTELIEARALVARMTEAVDGLTPHTAERTARAAAVRAALADPSADVVGPVLAGVAAGEAAQLRAQILREARDTAVAELSAAVDDLAETVLVDHLRPGLADVVSRAKAAHAVYSPHGGSERELFSAAPKVRGAWTEFAGAADTYQALVAARGVLVDLMGRPVQDDRGLFAQIRNTEHVWPELLTSRMPASTMVPPWPTDGARPFLAWAIQAGAAPWLPTGQEQDGRWLELYGPRIAEARQANQVMGQYREFLVV